MPDIDVVETEARSYLFQEKSCAHDPDEIGQAMGAAFGAVFGFAGRNGITPQSMPISVYRSHDADTMLFEAGVFVAAEDAARAEGEVRAATIPAGRALHTVHVGPYANLGDTYDALTADMKARGLKAGGPCWEVYVDDPGEVAEDKLRTEIFMALA